jgi:fucose 4-O-acetylase-like acetyltransferase
MTLETIKFGLLLTIIPFSAIFVLITACWALMDMSLRTVSGSRRIIWTLAVIALPLAGPIAYNYLVRRCTGFKKPSVDGLPGDLCKAMN